MYTVIITQRSSYDGVCAQAIVRNALHNTADYYSIRPGAQDIQQMIDLLQCKYPAETNVKFFGLAFNHGLLESLLEAYPAAQVFDYHIITREYCKPDPRLYYNPLTSAATLAWRCYNNNTELPTIVKYVQDRELWCLQLPHCKEIGRFFERGIRFDVNLWRWHLLDDKWTTQAIMIGSRKRRIE